MNCVLVIYIQYMYECFNAYVKLHVNCSICIGEKCAVETSFLCVLTVCLNMILNKKLYGRTS